MESSIRKINDVEKDLYSLRQEINKVKEVAEVKARLTWLEKILHKKVVKKKIGKKGQIDPRWIIIAIILILLYLFLKRQGVI
jgi:chromosome segregation ATPase